MSEIRGKTVLLTGGSSGIGLATAIELARQGADLTIVCRSSARGEETVRAVKAASGAQNVDFVVGDLARLDDVRKVASDYLASSRPLHVLINNAGIVNLTRELTPDGIEAVFAVNHLAPFLLTNLLLDRLRQSAPARIVTVASDAHKFVRGVNFDDLGFEQGYGWTKVYGQSKLANILFTYALAPKLDGSGVTANCLHPGAVGTSLGMNNGRWARGLIALIRPFMKTPEQGARTSVYLATSPDVEGVTGKYFANSREARSSKASHDLEAARQLWDISVSMTGLSEQR